MTSSSRHGERARGITLTLLDLTHVTAQARKEIAPAEPNPQEVDVSLGFEPYAMAEHGGKLYVVCHEGVGWEVTDDDPFPLDLYVSRPGHLAIAPRFSALLRPEEVRAAATEQTVDLADHVRRFGSRLEANFWTWHRALTAPVPAGAR